MVEVRILLSTPDTGGRPLWKADVHIATHHRTLIAIDVRTGLLRHVKELPVSGGGLVLVDIPDSAVAQLEELPVKDNVRRAFIAGGPLAGCE